MTLGTRVEAAAIYLLSVPFLPATDPVIAEVESSGESAADDADEHIKWKKENAVSYTKKEDKQYRRCSKGEKHTKKNDELFKKWNK